MALRNSTFKKTNNRSKPYPSVEQLYRASQTSYANAGGFLVEDEEPDESCSSTKGSGHSNRDSSVSTSAASSLSVESEAVGGHFTCVSCDKELAFSFLLDSFSYPVCDSCRKERDCFKLITRTDAKTQFLLKDCDLDVREPKLRFICRKNPHNPRWGDMKLYLKLQVEERAIAVWGDTDALEAAKSKRDTTRTNLREKRFEAKLKEMRNQVRSDLRKKESVSTHRHEYGEETYDLASDTYSQKCLTCNHVNSYEKM